MHVITKKTITNAIALHADAKSDLTTWYYEAKLAHWKTPQDIKKNTHQRVF